MNSRIWITGLLFLAVSHLSFADQDSTERLFRKLQRIPDGSAEVRDVLPLAKRLARQDPEHADKYLRETLDKVEAPGPVSSSEALREVQEISLTSQNIFEVVDKATEEVRKKLTELQKRDRQLTVQEVFEIQILMSRLSQLSETASAIMSATNSAISSMARNVKS